MSLILVFNKNLPWAHTESELGVLGVHGKLVKYVVQQVTSFWSQRILGVNCGGMVIEDLKGCKQLGGQMHG
jgi:hypothetical protein